MLKNKISRLRRLLFLLCSFNSSLYAVSTCGEALNVKASGNADRVHREFTREFTVEYQDRFVGQNRLAGVGQFDVNEKK